MTWFGLALVGLVVGLGVPLGLSVWLKENGSTQRGYLNAVAIGIQVAAAILIIPIALSEVEFASYTLLTKIVPASFGESNLIPWSLQFQVVLRSLGVVAILILFLRSNAPLLPQERAELLQQGQPLSWRARVQAGLALAPDGTIDRVSIFSVTLGLACYNLWRSAMEAPLEPNGSSFWLGFTLFVGLATAIGVSVLGLLFDLEQQRSWLISIPLLLGVTGLVGTLHPVSRLMLSVSPILLTIGTICLIFAIGRLLSIVQDQIGLDWPTTAAVGLSSILVYFGNEFIGRLI